MVEMFIISASLFNSINRLQKTNTSLAVYIDGYLNSDDIDLVIHKWSHDYGQYKVGLTALL